jgi:2-polyprenyl-3-methyl-5-hydroxy-6-metoxy-1,4-benzoquinol methylase
MQREFKNDFLELKVSLNSLSEKVSVLQDGDNAGKAELANFKIFVNQFTKKVSDYDAALVDKNRALEGFLQRLNKCEASVLENHTELELFAPLKNNFDKNLEKVQEFDKFLERFYSYYYRKVVDPSYIKEKFKNYLPFLHKDMDILDVACGRGEFLEVLKENGFTSAMGVDISKEFVKTNLNNGLTVVCESWDTYLACHRQEFDVITSFQFLEHLEITEIVDFLNKALLALKPKGILIVEFPNIESLTVGCNQFYLDVTHKSKINKTLFWHLSEFIGFDVVEEKNLTMLSALSEVEDKVINDNFMRLSHDIYGYFDKAFILRKNTDD